MYSRCRVKAFPGSRFHGIGHMIAIYGLGLKLFPRGGNEVEIMLMGWWLFIIIIIIIMVIMVIIIIIINFS